MKEEEKKSKTDIGRNESLKNAADLKIKIKEAMKDLNESLKEQKRLEMIHTVCMRNLAKNEEWINCLEKEIHSSAEMITYLNNKVHLTGALLQQRETDQKTREELFKEREEALGEFVGAMQIKTNALAETPASEDTTHKTESPGLSELNQEFSQEDPSPRHNQQQKATILSLKMQESAAAAEVIEKSTALRIIASTAGVDDPSKTNEIVKFFKQTEELEVRKPVNRK